MNDISDGAVAVETALDMVGLLTLAHQRGASDLHLKVGNHPILRIHGRLERATDLPVLDSAAARMLIESIMTEEQRAVFRERRELDFAYSLPRVSRFRVNVYQ